MKVTYRFMKFHAYEHEIVEEYLCNMAEKGWMITNMYSILRIQQFEKQEPKRCKFHVVYNPNELKGTHQEIKEKRNEYSSFVEEYGYRYVCANDVFLVFCSENKEAIELVDDSAETKKRLYQHVWRNEISVYLFAFIFLILVAYDKGVSFYRMDTFKAIVSILLILYFLFLFTFSIPALHYLIVKKHHTTIRKIKLRMGITFFLYMLAEITVCTLLGILNILYMAVFLLLEGSIAGLFVLQRKWKQTGKIIFAILAVAMLATFIAVVADREPSLVTLPHKEIPVLVDDMEAMDIKTNEVSFHKTESIFLREYSLYETYFDEQDNNSGELKEVEFHYILFVIKDTPFKQQVLSALLSDEEARQITSIHGLKTYENEAQRYFIKGNKVLQVPKKVPLTAANWEKLYKIFALE